MSEYIEREVALHGMDANIYHLRKVADGNPLLNKAINLVQYTRDFIAALPAADVVERKRGEFRVPSKDEYLARYKLKEVK